MGSKAPLTRLVEVATEKIELAEAILKDEEENYSFGKVTLNDYISAVNTLDTQRFNRVNAAGGQKHEPGGPLPRGLKHVECSTQVRIDNVLHVAGTAGQHGRLGGKPSLDERAPQSGPWHSMVPVSLFVGVGTDLSTYERKHRIVLFSTGTILEPGFLRNGQDV